MGSGWVPQSTTQDTQSKGRRVQTRTQECQSPAAERMGPIWVPQNAVPEACNHTRTPTDRLDGKGSTFALGKHHGQDMTSHRREMEEGRSERAAGSGERDGDLRSWPVTPSRGTSHPTQLNGLHGNPGTCQPFKVSCKRHPSGLKQPTWTELRCLVKQLEKGEVNVLDLKKNIEYAASVLEAVYIDETRQLLDTEDELCDIHSDAVPSEVRDWLASTFTKKMGVARRRPDEKPKFRSIVHAVQAGIFVDRMFRKTSVLVGLTYPPAVVEVLKDVDKWSFNVFALNEAGGEHALRFLVYELFTRYDLISRFRVPISALLNFVEALEVGYSKYKNPYHNLVHAADVTQTLHYFMVHTGLMHSLTELDIFAMVFAAAIHDFEHTGTTNNFHIQTRSDVAILYNDRSVLENHHVSAAYRLMQEPEMNILANLSKDDWRELRTLVVDMVLYTDMSGHFQHIKNIKNALQQPEGVNSGGAGGVVESVQKHSKKVSTEDQGSSTDYSLSSIDLKGFRCNWVDIMHQNKERWKELAVQEQARKERESTNNGCKHSDKKSEVTEITEVKLTRTDSEKDSDSVSELKSPCELNTTSCNSSQNSNSTSAPQRTQQQADSSLSNSTVREGISDRPPWNGNFFNNDQVLALPNHCLYSTRHNGSFTFRVTNFPKQKEVCDKDG
ncbi:Calcium/calmodulin-dependent 3',5'-cyclic nucleotide phosphodiesterase 1A [Acipenser ruthenus]|uniref:Phosphodiesterase n=1 Tax=Acipenser ruthenus TaxID=7906 RepID=A0A444U477_ACIRT|nr:Calcium/calmodulin-dependent 3',5'-cyclic nucleotide phosphodiesterase 1A [Acipenser ruthenus]